MVQNALRALPGVRRAEVDYEKKQAVLLVEERVFDPAAAEAAVKKAGFEGRVLDDLRDAEDDQSSNVDPSGTDPTRAAPEEAARAAAESRTVVLHVTGMMKSKSGAI